MTDKKPSDIKEYKEWLKRNHKIEVTDSTRVYYESVVNKIKSDLQNADCWSKLIQSLDDLNAEYLLRTGYPLLMPALQPELYAKPFESFLLKTFRKNIIDNRAWPNAPRDGYSLIKHLPKLMI